MKLKTQSQDVQDVNEEVKKKKPNKIIIIFFFNKSTKFLHNKRQLMHKDFLMAQKEPKRLSDNI